MPQATSYPDPAQLRAFAEEPMPFHELTPADLYEMPDGGLAAKFGTVEYHFVAAYMTVETETGEPKRGKNVEWFDVDHSEVIDRALDWQIEEDFICLTDFTTAHPDEETAVLNAFWMLDSITINSPDTP